MLIKYIVCFLLGSDLSLSLYSYMKNLHWKTGFILLVFLDMAKNIILHGSVHLDKVIHDRDCESEEKNSKISVFMTDTICGGILT